MGHIPYYKNTVCPDWLRNLFFGRPDEDHFMDVKYVFETQSVEKKVFDQTLRTVEKKDEDDDDVEKPDEKDKKAKSVAVEKMEISSLT